MSKKAKVLKKLPKAKPLLKKKVPAVVTPKKAAKVTKTREAKAAYGGPDGLFMLTTGHVTLAEAIAEGIQKVKGVLEQAAHKDYVAWAVPGKSGSAKRIGGLWVHGGQLCLQIRWMTPEVLEAAKEMGFTVLGTPEHNLKCNRVNVTDAKSAKDAVKLLGMQAKALQDGTAPSQNCNT